MDTSDEWARVDGVRIARASGEYYRSIARALAVGALTVAVWAVAYAIVAAVSRQGEGTAGPTMMLPDVTLGRAIGALTFVAAIAVALRSAIAAPAPAPTARAGDADGAGRRAALGAVALCIVPVSLVVGALGLVDAVRLGPGTLDVARVFGPPVAAVFVAWLAADAALTALTRSERAAATRARRADARRRAVGAIADLARGTRRPHRVELACDLGVGVLVMAFADLAFGVIARAVSGSVRSGVVAAVGLAVPMAFALVVVSTALPSVVADLVEHRSFMPLFSAAVTCALVVGLTMTAFLAVFSADVALQRPVMLVAFVLVGSAVVFGLPVWWLRPSRSLRRRWLRQSALVEVVGRRSRALRRRSWRLWRTPALRATLLRVLAVEARAR